MVRSGREIAVLSYGALASEAYDAVQLLTAQGHDVHFVNMRTLKPIDEAAVLHAARTTRLLVSIEDHFATGGLASIVAEVLLKHRTTARHLPIAFDGRWFTPTLLPSVLEVERLTGAHLAQRILAALADTTGVDAMTALYAVPDHYLPAESTR